MQRRLLLEVRLGYLDSDFMVQRIASDKNSVDLIKHNLNAEPLVTCCPPFIKNGKVYRDCNQWTLGNLPDGGINITILFPFGFWWTPVLTDSYQAKVPSLGKPWSVLIFLQPKRGMIRQKRFSSCFYDKNIAIINKLVKLLPCFYFSYQICIISAQLLQNVPKTCREPLSNT